MARVQLLIERYVQLHAISKVGPLIMIIQRPSIGSDIAKGTNVVEPRYSRKSIAMRMGRRYALVVARVAL